MKKTIALLLSIVMCIGIIPMTFAAEMNFEDVKPAAWYYNDVKIAVESGLVNGKSETSYAPEDNLTYAEAIKLAACMSQLYLEGSVTLKAGNPWYQSYVDYCGDSGIISKNYNYNDNATRAGYMEIFANALPDEGLKAINNVPNDAIPDVPSSRSYAAAVYKLYRAGILTGVDEAHNCDPLANIKRSEVAAILTRMMNEDKRILFSMGEEPEPTKEPGPTKEPEPTKEPSGGNTPTELTSKQFLMYAEDVLTITGKGTILTGKVVSGSIKLGDALQIVHSDGTVTKATAAGIEMYRKNLDSAEKGDNIGLLLNAEITKDMAARGDAVIGADADFTIANRLKGTLKLLSSEEGGRKTPIAQEDKAQFYYTSDVTGRFADLNGEAVAPGETRENVSVIFPKSAGVWYVGQELTVRDSGRTLGTFIVTEVIAGVAFEKEETTPLSIVTQPEDVTARVGKTVSFTIVAAGGKAPYSYQWEVSNGETWNKLSNTDENTVTDADTDTVKLLSTKSVIRLRCVITDADGNSVISNEAILRYIVRNIHGRL